MSERTAVHGADLAPGLGGGYPVGMAHPPHEVHAATTEAETQAESEHHADALGAVEDREVGSWQIGAFQFDLSSGELRRLGGGPGDRLPPQPARLLALLAERAGEVVGHEEIRAHLWPAVQVDFEQGLHFCVRQVRSALGDDASQPRYVETLPRRGYRLVAKVEKTTPSPGASSSPAPADAAQQKPKLPPLGLSLAIVALAILVVFVATRWEWQGEAPERTVEASETTVAPRLAVMPFRFSPDLGSDLTPVAEHLLVRLGALGVDRLAVIGPTTTNAWESSLPVVHRMMEELELQYVLNARLINDGEVLVELIRADGAHLWVRAFADLDDPLAIAREVGDGVLEALALDPPPDI